MSSTPQLAPSRSNTARDMPDDGRVFSPASPAGHLLFALTDPVAARYIEEDPHMTCEVLARRQRIEGYEIYLVEQWACSRSDPTFLITTYTGNPSDFVLATVISVPADEDKWSPQMRLYFHSLSEYHARQKETPYGILMITNLSGFPSSLTVIPVPDGDLKKYRETFIVNENLKRLGCSGRLGITLAPPNSATQAKFHQLYRTSEKIPFNASVIELVKLCQVALVLFGTLEPEYADGLLCDVTEKAINDWWIEFGADYYTVEPHDGILGPTTVAAILGMLMGARNRLSACNSAVAKDVFDIESTKRSIAHFQKSHHLPKTRRLDRHTLDKLRRATAKAASKESWAVPRAFKSTVAELGGKGGEMVMGIVGAGQKDGIAEVETVDIDQFVELVRGEHAKWLWHGKPRKATSGGDMFDRLPREERSVSPDKHSHGMKALSRVTTLEQQKLVKRDTAGEDSPQLEPTTSDGVEKDKDAKDPYSKRATIKAKSGSGFHHIKNAVSLRTHASKLSRDDHGRHGHHRAQSETRPPDYTDANGASPYNAHAASAHSSEDPYSLTSPLGKSTPAFTKVLTETPSGSVSSIKLNKSSEQQREPATVQLSVAESNASTQPPSPESSVAGSIYHGVDLNSHLPVEQARKIPILLRRTRSSDQLDSYRSSRNDEWWPRHLSFSIAEDSVLRWKGLATVDASDNTLDNQQDLSNANLAARTAVQNMQSEQMKRLLHQLALVSSKDTTWVDSRLQEILHLEAAGDADIETLDSIYYPRLDTYHALREDTHAILTSSRLQLTTSLRELSNVGDKLDYEISALRGKVDDADDVLGDFERQVELVEHRADELDRLLSQREGWAHWLLRILTGIGRPPG